MPTPVASARNKNSFKLETEDVLECASSVLFIIRELNAVRRSRNIVDVVEKILPYGRGGS
jgi:hypothetical protein